MLLKFDLRRPPKQMTRLIHWGVTDKFHTIIHSVTFRMIPSAPDALSSLHPLNCTQHYYSFTLSGFALLPWLRCWLIVVMMIERKAIMKCTIFHRLPLWPKESDCGCLKSKFKVSRITARTRGCIIASVSGFDVS